MDLIYVAIFSAIFLAVFIFAYQQIQSSRRSTFIANYNFPESIKNKVSKTYPHLGATELEQVIKGLRDYFHLNSLSKKQMVAMPSQVVDVAWHEFILFTKEYSLFCSRAFGHFLHHTPAEAMKSTNKAQSSIKKTWRISCFREQINPHAPKRLPFIFSLDAKLKIEDGFHYELDCMKSMTSKEKARTSGNVHCGSHIGCASGCAGGTGIGGYGDDGGAGGCTGSGGCGGGD